jgi:membrane-bound inhibitor of C-type lysozyme
MIHALKIVARATLAGLAAALAAGSLPGSIVRAEELPSERLVQFACHGESDHRQLTALFFNEPPAEVVLLYENGQAGAVRLFQQRSGSGARYGDGSQTFWVKGDTAIYQRGGSYQCKAIQAP